MGIQKQGIIAMKCDRCGENIFEWMSGGVIQCAKCGKVYYQFNPAKEHNYDRNIGRCGKGEI